MKRNESGRAEESHVGKQSPCRRDNTEPSSTRGWTRVCFVGAQCGAAAAVPAASTTRSAIIAVRLASASRSRPSARPTPRWPFVPPRVAHTLHLSIAPRSPPLSLSPPPPCPRPSQLSRSTRAPQTIKRFGATRLSRAHAVDCTSVIFATPAYFYPICSCTLALYADQVSSSLQRRRRRLRRSEALRRSSQALGRLRE